MWTQTGPPPQLRVVAAYLLTLMCHGVTIIFIIPPLRALQHCEPKVSGIVSYVTVLSPVQMDQCPRVNVEEDERC